MKLALKVFTICLLLASNAWGATHYVSASATGSGNGSIDSPWTTAQAMTNAAADDIVYFRGGTYSYTGATAAAYHGVYEPTHTGTEGHPITFMAYPGENPVFSVNWSNNAHTGWIFGTNESSYIIYDGFTVQTTDAAENAGFMIGGDMDLSPAHGNKVTNCTISGGSTQIDHNDNYDLNRMEDCVDCEFSYNEVGPFPGGTGDADNYAGIKLYHILRGTIKNNNFVNCYSGGVSFKGWNTDCVVENNWFTGGNFGIRTCGYTAGLTKNQTVRNNVFFDTGYNAYWLYAENDGNDGGAIYNNSIYDCGVGIQIGRNTNTSSGWDIYNNVIVSSPQIASFVGTCYIDTMDHNEWGNSSFSVAGYTSLANLRASNLLYASTPWGYSAGGCTSNQHPGCGDLQTATSSIFTNGSGNLNTLADFELKTGYTGIGGGRSSGNIGADVSLVGTGAEEEEDTTPPSTPSLHGVSLHGVNMR